MKKSEVQTHSEMGRQRHPALNVRWHLWPPEVISAFKGAGNHEFSDDAEFWEFVQEAWDGDQWDRITNAAYEFTAESGWEDAKGLAAEVFPSPVQVYSEGRCGGWLVVFGLPDIETWDAIDMSRWNRFARGVEEILDDLDHRFVWNLAANVWEPSKAERENLARRMVMS